MLDVAIKNASSQRGILAVPMLKFAAAINNPLFQKVQSTIGEDRSNQQKQVLEQQSSDSNLTQLSVEVRISKADFNYISQNINPPPPPAPPAPASNHGVDYAVVAAEMDGVLQNRAYDMSHAALAHGIRQV